MSDQKSADFSTKLFQKFMELQNWTKEEEKSNLEFIDSMENQARNQKKVEKISEFSEI